MTANSWHTVRLHASSLILPSNLVTQVVTGNTGGDRCREVKLTVTAMTEQIKRVGEERHRTPGN